MKIDLTEFKDPLEHLGPSWVNPATCLSELVNALTSAGGRAMGPELPVVFPEALRADNVQQWEDAPLKAFTRVVNCIQFGPKMGNLISSTSGEPISFMTGNIESTPQYSGLWKDKERSREFTTICLLNFTRWGMRFHVAKTSLLKLCAGHPVEVDQDWIRKEYDHLKSYERSPFGPEEWKLAPY